MHRAPALSFLLVTVFIDMLGLGLIVPILPSLLTSVTADAASAVLWSGLLGSTYGLLQFVVAPLLGRLADRYGRRPVLLVSLGCLGIDWLAHAISGAPWALLLFHALAGACAGTNTVVNAYIADTTPPERRPRAYGLVGAAFGIGFVAGPAIGGLLGAVDVRLPFFAAAGLCFLNVAYGALILPESRRGDRVTLLTLRTANPVTAIVVVLRRPVLGRLAASRLCADVSRMIHQSTWTFFLTYQFAWSTARIGTVMAVFALLGAVFQTWAVAPVVNRLGDRRAAVAGTLLSAFVLAGTAFATVPWMLCALQVLAVVSAVGGAAELSWVSRTVHDDEQGTVQGALTGIGAAAETAVPLAAGVIFGWSLAYAFPGLVFVVAAGFRLMSAFLLATTPQK
ncbi:MFS transporter [Catenuloplanes japonicus]|uniref:MFS transporter n=1 Tax=Catenuloplanes japonicus TaxID=33876 RepID=UPI00068BE18A|nr:MFS transporter [Catenuloplanes japonicus]